MLVLMMSACGNTQSAKETSDMKQPTEEIQASHNILVTYFSRVGNTEFPSDVDTNTSASIIQSDGSLMGNTEALARMIQEKTGGDLHLIKAQDPYPVDYDETDLQGKAEHEQETKVTIQDDLGDFSKYDVIFIGYPIWYYDMPRAVYSFFETYDLADKIIIPFCTSGGNGLSNTIKTIRTLEPNATVIDEGFSVRHNMITELDEQEVTTWLHELALLQEEK